MTKSDKTDISIKLTSGLKKYLCFRLACVPKKPPSLKIFMEHLEKAVSCVILVLNRENRMKIGQEMAEYGRKTI